MAPPIDSGVHTDRIYDSKLDPRGFQFVSMLVWIRTSSSRSGLVRDPRLYVRRSRPPGPRGNRGLHVLRLGGRRRCRPRSRPPGLRANGSSSFFNQIDDIEPYGADDRTGPGISDLLTGFTGTTVVDVAVWPSGTYPEVPQRRATLVESVVEGNREVLLRSVSARRTYFRVQVAAAGLADLLNTSVVELVRTPPVPFLDFRDWRDIDVTTLSRVVEESEVVGVLDDSPESGHPLLDGLVLSDESLAPSGYAWQQRGSHGTEVVGRVLLPSLHEELRDAQPITAVGSVRVARILEPDPQRPQNPPWFATYAAPHVLVEEAIRRLHGTYGVRVFNLSVGYAEPFNDLHVGPMTETIDDLVRELGIVVVVPVAMCRSTWAHERQADITSLMTSRSSSSRRSIESPSRPFSCSGSDGWEHCFERCARGDTQPHRMAGRRRRRRSVTV